MMVRSVFLLLFGVLTIKGDLGRKAIGVIYTIDIVPPRQSDDFDSFDKTIKKSAADMLLDHMLSDSHKLIPERLLNGGNRNSSDMPEEFKYFSRRKRDINANPANPSASAAAARQPLNQDTEKAAAEFKYFLRRKRYVYGTLINASILKDAARQLIKELLNTEQAAAVSSRSFDSNSPSRPLPQSVPKFNLTFNLITNETQAPVAGLPYPLPNVPSQLPNNSRLQYSPRETGFDGGYPVQGKPFSPPRGSPKGFGNTSSPLRPPGSGPFGPSRPPFPSAYNSSGGASIRPVSVNSQSGSDFNPSNSSLYGTLESGRVQQNLNSSLNTSTVGTWGLGPKRDSDGFGGRLVVSPQRTPPQRRPPQRPPPLRPPPLRPSPLGTVDGLNSSWPVRPPGLDPNRSRPLLSFHDRSTKLTM